MPKYVTFNIGYNITCTINRKYGMARNFVCFRYVIVNTLYNDDDDDDHHHHHDKKYEEQSEIKCRTPNEPDCAGR